MKNREDGIFNKILGQYYDRVRERVGHVLLEGVLFSNEAQADYWRHGDEIVVIVKEEEVVSQGYLGNETVDCAPDSDSLSATGKIDAGCLGV